MAYIDPFSLPPGRSFAESPILDGKIGDDRAVRMSASQFTKRFKDDINDALYIDKQLREAARIAAEVELERSKRLYPERVAAWAAKAKRVHRHVRRQMAKSIRAKRLMLPKAKIAQFRKEADRWTWRSSQEILTTLSIKKLWELQAIYSDTDLPESIRVDELAPRDLSTQHSEAERTVAFLEIPGREQRRTVIHVLQSLQELLDIATKHPVGTMLYLSVSQMHLIINLRSTVIKDLIDHVTAIDHLLEKYGIPIESEKRRFIKLAQPQPALIPAAP